MFTDSLRVRVNGIVINDGKMLLVQIQSPTNAEPFWMPPGGGVQFKESLEVALVREMQEETGLDVEPQNLVFVSEYLKNDWHAVEFYYLCKIGGGQLHLGSDPELGLDAQMLRDIRWFGRDEIENIPLFPGFLRDEFDSLINGNVTSLRFLPQL